MRKSNICKSWSASIQPVSMPESVLLVGLGQIGMGYDLSLDPEGHVYSHARAFSLHPDFELAGAVDPSEINRGLFKDHYGKPVYFDLGEALKRHQPRIVTIAAPTGTHSSLTEQVLKYSGVDVILCEKPLAYSINDARNIVARCRDAGVALFVNYMRRVDKGVLEVKRRLEEGTITTPVKGTVWYSKGFLHNGSHLFNLLEFWLGSFVSATVLDHGRSWGEDDVEPDVYLEFERGKVVFQAAWEEAFSHYSIEIISPSGRLKYENRNGIVWQSTTSDSRLSGYTVLQSESEIIEDSMHHYQWHVTDQLACHLDSKPQSLCTGEQALATLEAMHHIINFYLH